MKLTDHFTLDEFQSKDGATMPLEVAINIYRVAMELEVLRRHVRRRITINSGYRSPAHNAAVGGAHNSQHMKGTAADIVVQDMKPEEVAATIQALADQNKMQVGWMKIYPSFVHFDIRGVYGS